MPIYSGVSQGALDAKFNAACTSLSRVWLQQGFAMYNSTLISDIARVETGNRKALVQQKLIINASNYKIVGLTDPTEYTKNPPKIIAECGYSRVDLFGIDWGDLEDDDSKMSTIASITQLGGYPALVPLTESLRVLANNKVTLYDDKPLFDATHNIDPFGTSAGTGSNIISQALTGDGWNKALQQIITRKDPGSKNNKPQLPNGNLNGRNLTILCGHVGVASALVKIFDPASQWATQVETGISAASESRRVYTQATIQLVPEMAAIGTDAGVITDPATYCYIMVNNTPNRGLFCRIPDLPTVSEPERIADKHMTRRKGFQTFGIEPSWPWALYKWTFT